MTSPQLPRSIHPSRTVYCPKCVKEWSTTHRATCGEWITDLEGDPTGQTRVWSTHDSCLIIVD